jgi:hypothetical protein
MSKPQTIPEVPREVCDNRAWAEARHDSTSGGQFALVWQVLLDAKYVVDTDWNTGIDVGILSFDASLLGCGTITTAVDPDM